MNLIEDLIQRFIQAIDSNEVVKKYAQGRLDSNGRYTGWVNPASTAGSASLKLDLTNDYERFLLFCLASAWSASGQWENAATIIYVIRMHCPEMASPHAWARNAAIESGNSLEKMIGDNSNVFQPRKRITKIRGDIFSAFGQIADNWTMISKNLLQASRSGDWERFVVTLRETRGLAPGNHTDRPKALLIKIPLILRELRCQNIFPNIPGELCCVPDGRVIDAVRFIRQQSGYDDQCGLKGYRPGTAKGLIASSKAIYRNFGDLYDLPLFAAVDIYDDLVPVRN